jgi:2-oxoglutarate dehydrogenase E2 component (dihydrolipoamide succinyltransferase)
MSKIELELPAMGEGIIEATIIRWLKEEGESIEVDEPIVEIATDKVDSEVPSPIEGILHKKLFNDGDIPKVGEVIAILSTGGDIENSVEENKKEINDFKEETELAETTDIEEKDVSAE